MPHSYPPEFRVRVMALVEAGRPIKQIAEMLGTSDQTIYNWRRRHLIDTGQAPGIFSSENAELIAARRRIAELEQELAIYRRAAELLDALGTGRKTGCRWRCPAQGTTRLHWEPEPGGRRRYR